MSFATIQFLAFLLITFCIYWLLPHRFRWILLLVSSSYFYMQWKVRYIIWIFLTITVSYVFGIIIDNSDNPKKRKACLILTCILCLSVLFIFKYFNFFVESIGMITHFWGIKISKFMLPLILPVGISFYTFQKVIGILPPFAPSIYDEMVKSKNYTYIESLMQEIEPLFQKYEYEVFDYSDGAKVNVSDEYFIDGFHGSEIVYNLIIQQIMLSSNTLDGVVDEMELKKLYDNRYSELTFEIPL